MQSETFKIENVRCSGCVKTIVEGVGSLPGVASVTVTVEDDEVTILGDGLSRASLAAKLAELGYPETGG